MIDRTARNGKPFNRHHQADPGPPEGVREEVIEPQADEADNRELILCIAPGGTWGSTFNPIRHVEGAIDENQMLELREEAGFHRMCAFGEKFALVRVEMFRHVEGDCFLAEVEIADHLETVLIQGFAPLLKFLREVAPVVELGRQCADD